MHTNIGTNLGHGTVLSQPFYSSNQLSIVLLWCHALLMPKPLSLTVDFFAMQNPCEDALEKILAQIQTFQRQQMRSETTRRGQCKSCSAARQLKSYGTVCFLPNDGSWWLITMVGDWSMDVNAGWRSWCLQLQWFVMLDQVACRIARGPTCDIRWFGRPRMA